MTTDPYTAANDPRSVLAATRNLTSHVRRVQRAGWFPLLVFATVTVAAIPFDRYTGERVSAHCAAVGPGRKVCNSPGPTWYWLVAVSLAYEAITLYYLRRSRRHGLGRNVRAYVIAGVVLLVLVTAWSAWILADPAVVVRDLHLGSASPVAVSARLASPDGAIGLALVVLAWIERSTLLALVTAAYLLIVVTAAGGHHYHDSRPVPLHLDPWGFLPHVLILGGILLAGSITLALIQRPTAQPAT
jgi:hypothetical protein